jgi:hypothetical protein
MTADSCSSSLLTCKYETVVTTRTGETDSVRRMRKLEVAAHGYCASSGRGILKEACAPSSFAQRKWTCARGSGALTTRGAACGVASGALSCSQGVHPESCLCCIVALISCHRSRFHCYSGAVVNLFCFNPQSFGTSQPTGRRDERVDGRGDKSRGLAIAGLTSPRQEAWAARWSQQLDVRG